MSTKVHLLKDMVFPVIMYGYKSWAIKNTEKKKQKRKLSTEKLMLLNCDVGDDS